MGLKPGYRQVTIYVEPRLYERWKQAAYTLEENMYDFAAEAISNAVGRRLTKSQRNIVEIVAKQHASRNGHGKNGASRAKRG